MAIQDSSKLVDGATAFKVAFDNVFGTVAEDNWKAYCAEDTHTGIEYEWSNVEILSKSREWIGELMPENLRAVAHKIPTKPYTEATRVSQVEYTQDPERTGKRLRQWLSSQGGFINSLVVTKLLRGMVDECFDGQPLFSPSHPNGPNGALQSNTGTATLSLLNYRATRESMMALARENGAPMGIRPSLLVCGASLEGRARDILKTQVRSQAVSSAGALDGTTNVVGSSTIDNVHSVDGVDILVEPRLDHARDANGAVAKYYWFLIDQKVMPLVVSEAMPITPVDDTDQLVYVPDFTFQLKSMHAIGEGHFAGINAQLATS